MIILFLKVTPFVIIPIPKRRERLPALSAFERFLTGVQSHVHLEVRLLDGCLGAVRAFVPHCHPLIQMLLLEVTS